MQGKFKYYLILHIIVLVWGITGILGDEIVVSAEKITFFRTGISFVSLLLVGLFIKESKKLSPKELLFLLGTGVIVGLHWFCFFYSIKVSTVSIGVVCMSSSTLFTSSFLMIILFFIFNKHVSPNYFRQIIDKRSQQDHCNSDH